MCRGHANRPRSLCAVPRLSGKIEQLKTTIDVAANRTERNVTISVTLPNEAEEIAARAVTSILTVTSRHVTGQVTLDKCIVIWSQDWGLELPMTETFQMPSHPKDSNVPKTGIYHRPRAARGRNLQRPGALNCHKLLEAVRGWDLPKGRTHQSLRTAKLRNIPRAGRFCRLRAAKRKTPCGSYTSSSIRKLPVVAITRFNHAPNL
ncbi:hypothetical protein J6590_022327 [Homalodisca vitripennis]|nr:hypothetical protein J6590_022327 [Homalodisca vitripennis]